MVDYRLPLVDGDDGTWGDILNAFIGKEHVDIGSYAATSGNHKTVTITEALSDVSAVAITPTITATGTNNATAFNLSPTLDPPDTKRALGAYMAPTVVATAAETVESYRGIEIDAATKSGTGTITNSYQLYIRDQTIASNNYGVAIEAANTVTLWLSSDGDNTGAYAGIAFGVSKDTNLYRSTTNTLKTDDNLIVGAAGTAAGSAATIDATQTLTNKRVTPRITTISPSTATPTINTDNCDAVTIPALAHDINTMSTNLSGSPTNFQKLIFRIKDDTTVRNITWGASFVANGVTPPAATVSGKLLSVGFIYDTVAGTWGCVASAQEA